LVQQAATTVVENVAIACGSTKVVNDNYHEKRIYYSDLEMNQVYFINKISSNYVRSPENPIYESIDFERLMIFKRPSVGMISKGDFLKRLLNLEDDEEVDVDTLDRNFQYLPYSWSDTIVSIMKWLFQERTKNVKIKDQGRIHVPAEMVVMENDDVNKRLSKTDLEVRSLKRSLKRTDKKIDQILSMLESASGEGKKRKLGLKKD